MYRVQHLWEWNSRQELIKKQEKEIQTVVAKLAYAEEGVRRELTCMNCLSVFDNPVSVTSLCLARTLASMLTPACYCRPR